MKRTRLKRSRKVVHAQVSQKTRRIAWHRTGGFCACGCGRLAEDPHHIFYRQHHPELIDVADNIVPLARICHENHHAASKRLPRKVCRHAEHLAVTFPMMAFLDRTYTG